MSRGGLSAVERRPGLADRTASRLAWRLESTSSRGCSRGRPCSSRAPTAGTLSCPAGVTRA